MKCLPICLLVGALYLTAHCDSALEAVTEDDSNVNIEYADPSLLLNNIQLSSKSTFAKLLLMVENSPECTSCMEALIKMHLTVQASITYILMHTPKYLLTHRPYFPTPHQMHFIPTLG